MRKSAGEHQSSRFENGSKYGSLSTLGACHARNQPSNSPLAVVLAFCKGD